MVNNGDWLDAPAVQLEAVAPEVAMNYLDTSAHQGGIDRWEEARDLVCARTGPVAAALSSPLMISLARAVYQSSSTKPGELGSPRYTSAEDVETHLLKAFVPAVFPKVPTPERTGGRWKGGDAERWLVYLATEVNQNLKNGQFGWWDLTKFARPATAIATGIVGGTLAGTSVGLGAWLVFQSAVVGLGAGVVIATVMGVCCGRTTPLPATIQFGWRGRFKAVMLSALPIGVLGFIAVDIAGGLTLGLLVGVALAIPVGTLYGMLEPDATPRASNPHSLLRSDIQVAIVFAVAYGVPLGIVSGYLRGLIPGVIFGIATALSGGLVYGPVWMLALRPNKVGVMAWIHFVSARLWFSVRGGGQLPWRLMDFLNDAHTVGVLRESGGSYEFSNALLRNALADESPVRDQESTDHGAGTAPP